MCRSYCVRGRVQGVFFRRSTQIEAERLQLSGWARNLPDRSVEIYALGAAAAISEFEVWLQHGPPLARVDEVSASDAAVQMVTSFEIR